MAAHCSHDENAGRAAVICPTTAGLAEPAQQQLLFIRGQVRLVCRRLVVENRLFKSVLYHTHTVTSLSEAARHCPARRVLDNRVPHIIHITSDDILPQDTTRVHPHGRPPVPPPLRRRSQARRRLSSAAAKHRHQSLLRTRRQPTYLGDEGARSEAPERPWAPTKRHGAAPSSQAY